MTTQDFDQYGNFFGVIPDEAVNACSHPGECYFDCEAWVHELNFQPPREQAIDYLAEFGAWKREALQEKSDEDMAILVLWIACGDIKENGEWIGLSH